MKNIIKFNRKRLLQKIRFNEDNFSQKKRTLLGINFLKFSPKYSDIVFDNLRKLILKISSNYNHIYSRTRVVKYIKFQK